MREPLKEIIGLLKQHDSYNQITKQISDLDLLNCDEMFISSYMQKLHGRLLKILQHEDNPAEENPLYVIAHQALEIIRKTWPAQQNEPEAVTKRDIHLQATSAADNIIKKITDRAIYIGIPLLAFIAASLVLTGSGLVAALLTCLLITTIAKFSCDYAHNYFYKTKESELKEKYHLNNKASDKNEVDLFNGITEPSKPFTSSTKRLSQHGLVPRQPTIALLPQTASAPDLNYAYHSAQRSNLPVGEAKYSTPQLS